MVSARAPLKSLDEAMAALLGHAQPALGTEWVSTFDADGRVLAQDVVSALQVPAADNSSMDGYAVRCADVLVGAVLPVSQRIAAGNAGAPLQPGTVERIFFEEEVFAVFVQNGTSQLDGQPVVDVGSQ